MDESRSTLAPARSAGVKAEIRSQKVGVVCGAVGFIGDEVENYRKALIIQRMQARPSMTLGVKGLRLS